MSVDRRLRERLEREADGIAPDVEQPLVRVLAGARRRRRRYQVASGALAVVAIVAVVFVAPRAIDAIRSSSLFRPAAPKLLSPGPDTKEIFRLLSGTYTVGLQAAENSVRSNDLTGTWTIALHPDGTMDLSESDAFHRVHGAAPTGNSFTVSADTLKTNALYNDFCSSIGMYRWSLSGQELTLTVANDDCAIRRALLSTVPLERTP